MTLPNFYIAGGARCGSTSLEAYCRAHPDVFMSQVKEPNFFSYGCGNVPFAGPGREDVYAAAVKDRSRYEALFKGAQEAHVVGEASINYMLHPEACAGIRNLTPDAKLVFILRQPVDRAWSSFQRSRLQGREPEAVFLDAWRDDARRRRAGHWISIHRYKSLYGRHLRCWFETFPREQIKIILFEEFRTDTEAVMRELYSFLGVDPAFQPDTTVVHNQTGEIANPIFRALWKQSTRLRAELMPLLPVAWRGQLFRFLARGERIRRKSLPLPAELHTQLTEELRGDISELEELIGRELSCWYESI